MQDIPAPREDVGRGPRPRRLGVFGGCTLHLAFVLHILIIGFFLKEGGNFV